ncbi:B-related factor 1 [Aphelenchoides besseyi]|nr:B-related factor 1 [Aphelenchoides besseyi]
MGRTCPHCNSSEIDEDPSRGDATCMNCGTVLEESRIVSDVQFQESGSGGHEMIGQFVSNDRSLPNGISGSNGMAKPESREVTYYKGKKAHPRDCISTSNQSTLREHGLQFLQNVCVSELYTRTSSSSRCCCLDVTQVNVFDLGRTLNFLTRSLKINLPTTDPCLYVLRFAILLEFGDKQKEVVTFATRIVQRMKRDWMSTGRRPTGICGAALLLAARAFNINRSIGDIVRVVHISETVVRKRIDEFTSTPSGSLTIDEFNIVDLEESEDPPAFQASKRRYRESKRIEEEMQADQAVKEVGDIQKEVEEALKQKMKRSPYAKLVSGIGNDSDLNEAADVIRGEIIDSVYQMAEDGTSETTNDEMEQPHSMSHQAQHFGPTLTSLGIASQTSASNNIDSTITNSAIEEKGELDLEGIDDEEIDSYILSNEESKVKSELWLQRNGAVMQDIEKRQKLKQEQEEKDKVNPKSKRKLAKKVPINAANHNEAMLQVIQVSSSKKKLSNKINYEFLKELESHTQLTIPAALTEIPNGCDISTPIAVSIQSPSVVSERVRTVSISSVSSVANKKTSIDEISSALTTQITVSAPGSKPVVAEPSSAPIKELQQANQQQSEPAPSSPTKSAFVEKTSGPAKPPTQSRYKRNMVAPKLGSSKIKKTA